MSRFRTRELEKSGGHGESSSGLGTVRSKISLHGLGWHLAADRRAGPAAVAARLDEPDRRMLGGVPGREASPAIHSFPSLRMRFLASRSSRSSALGSGSPASSRRWSWTHLPTVYGLTVDSQLVTLSRGIEETSNEGLKRPDNVPL